MTNTDHVQPTHTTAQTILDGLTHMIGEAFPAAQVFADRVPQGIETCAFFVRTLYATRKTRTGLMYGAGAARSRVKHSDVNVEVTYFPSNKMGEQENECRAVEEELLDLLDIVPTMDGALIKGENIRSNISDGVLVATVKFAFSTLYIPEVNMINELKMGGITYGG